MFNPSRTLGSVRENSWNTAMVRTQIAAARVPGREVGSFKRKLHLMAGFDSPPKNKAALWYDGAAPSLLDKRRAAAPAPARIAQAHQTNLMAERKIASCVTASREGGSHNLTTPIGKSVPRPNKSLAGFRTREESSSPRSLTLKATSSSPSLLRKRRISSTVEITRKSSSSARLRPIAESASPHKNSVLVRKREANRLLMAKAGSASSATKSRASLQTMAKATSGCAESHLNCACTSSSQLKFSLLPKSTYAFAKHNIMRSSSRIQEEPRWPSVDKKEKPEPINHHARVHGRLTLFRELAMKLQREKEEKPDMKAFKILKERGMTPTRKYLGEVPGVEVGEEFCYRTELMVAGLHGTPIAGIDYTRFQGISVATCVVSSFNGYVNTMEGSDVLVYSGEGGNPCFESTRKGSAGDQRLERGNLALKNSKDTKKPVRVVHGFRVPRGGESLESKQRMATKYVYDGLYQVEDFWWEQGPKGFVVLKFQLRRMPGQPKLDLKQVRRLRGQRSCAGGRRIDVDRRDKGGDPEQLGKMQLGRIRH